MNFQYNEPKAVMAKKARKEFLNELENGTQVSSESDKEDSDSDTKDEIKKKTIMLECRKCGDLGYYEDIMDDPNDFKYGTCADCEDEDEGSFMLSFDDYIYLLEECVSPKQLKKIKKAYIKKELNDECFEIEWGLELNEEEQKEKDKLEPYECGIKVKIDEDDVISEFTHYITYNGSSAFAMWLCGVMN